MRIVQLIDSLEAGGAERMAVNYANALSNTIDFSALVATRNEGGLKQQLEAKVDYRFLNKKRTVDIAALFRLRKYIITNRVQLIHAHSSSFFMAVLVKLIYPKIKIVWHDHNGNRVKLARKVNKKIIWASSFFDGTIACNTDLKIWAENHLKTKNVSYIPNFTQMPREEKQMTFLRGMAGKRIVCLANLKTPKNHITLLRVFANSQSIQSGWTLHLIGKDHEDAYSNELKCFVRENSLEDKVFFYGSSPDVFSVLRQADIGVLLSSYEGFPVTLLEYGLSSLAVLSTNAGYCRELIDDDISGFLVDPLSVSEIQSKLDLLTMNKELQEKFSDNLNAFVVEKFSASVLVNSVIDFYGKM